MLPPQFIFLHNTYNTDKVNEKATLIYSHSQLKADI